MTRAVRIFRWIFRPATTATLVAAGVDPLLWRVFAYARDVTSLPLAEISTYTIVASLGLLLALAAAFAQMGTRISFRRGTQLSLALIAADLAAEAVWRSYFNRDTYYEWRIRRACPFVWTGLACGLESHSSVHMDRTTSAPIPMSSRSTRARGTGPRQ